MISSNQYGIHRVIEPAGFLPQPAWKIDNSPEISASEILIDVSTLNVDSTSFKQIYNKAGGDMDKIKEEILSIVEKRGKLHNPVTNSGGILTGKVAAIGEHLNTDLETGDRIATLVSLSLTPLLIEKIIEIRPHVEQVDIEGSAVLFESGIYTKLPEDIEEKTALAVLDVCGAPGQASRHVKTDHIVAVIGAGGKSGILTIAEAKKKAGLVVAIEYSDSGCQLLEQLNIADHIINCNAQNAPETYNQFTKITRGKLADVVFNNVNVTNTEMSSILITKDRGKICFFSMATDFARAALGAEGVGKDIDMLIGNGYTRGHAEKAFQILRENHTVRELFTGLFS